MGLLKGSEPRLPSLGDGGHLVRGGGRALGALHRAVLRRALQALGSLNWGEGVPEKTLHGSAWCGLGLLC